MRLVQLKAGEVRRVAVVEEPKLRLLRNFDSMYAWPRRRSRTAAT